MQWSNPITPDEIDIIDPILHEMASRFSRCAADRKDYVQTAYLSLFNGRQYKNPLAASYSAMIDYYRRLTKSRYRKVSLELTGDYEYEGQDFAYESSEVEDTEFQSLDWLNVAMTKKQKKAAQLVWIDGYTQAEAATLLDTSTTNISRWLSDLKDKITKKYSKGMFN